MACAVCSAPAGIDSVQPDEMIVSLWCGNAGERGQRRVGRARSARRDSRVGDGRRCVGASDTATIRRLGDGPIRDVLLQARYVSSAGEVVKAGGPTVKNVSGFDLCRLLVGSRGTLGFLGDVILRTRPLASHSQWFSADGD